MTGYEVVQLNRLLEAKRIIRAQRRYFKKEHLYWAYNGVGAQHACCSLSIRLIDPTPEPGLFSCADSDVCKNCIREALQL